MKKDTMHKIIGGKHRARSRYAMILNRCKGEGSKNRGYIGVNVLISKDEFIEWFMPRDFEGCSVDRIDSKGDYTLENMQVIPIKQNIIKDKVKHIDGKCLCPVCREIKDSDCFVKDKRRTCGFGTICKKCDYKRPKRTKVDQ